MQQFCKSASNLKLRRYTALERVGPRMNTQDVSQTLWGFLVLAATQGLPLPACYPSLWRAARELFVGSDSDLELRMLFHSYLIHTELVGGDEAGAHTRPLFSSTSTVSDTKYTLDTL